MMWDLVMAHVQTLVLADATLSGIFGTNFRKAGVSDMLIPVIEWTLLSDVETELWAPMLVQFDLWTDVAADARIAERAMRGMFHQAASIPFDGYTFFTEYADGVDLATPSRANYTGRGIRFRMTPLRQQYALPGVVL
jgi:hypothetical protein